MPQSILQIIIYSDPPLQGGYSVGAQFAIAGKIRGWLASVARMPVSTTVPARLPVCLIGLRQCRHAAY